MMPQPQAKICTNSTIWEESVHVAIMAGTMFAHGMRGSVVSIFSLYTYSRYICLCLGSEDDIEAPEANLCLFYKKKATLLLAQCLRRRNITSFSLLISLQRRFCSDPKQSS